MINCPSPSLIARQVTQSIRSKAALEHTCHFKTCTIVNLPVEIHKLMDKFYVRCPYLRFPTNLTDETLHEKLYNIYICKNTGKIHYCHPECTADKIWSESMEICTVSGQQFGEEEVRSWNISSRTQSCVSCDKSDPLKYSRDKNGRVLKSSGVHNTKEEQCKMIARDFIHAFLFSNIRLKSEIHKIAETKKDAEKIVNKYKRYNDKNGLVKNYIHMYTIYLNQMKKRPSNAHLITKTSSEQHEIIKQYTKELISYWKMILYMTELGRQSPSQFNFKIFSPACLYIMKNGLHMNQIYIIRKSKYLNLALPETNTLDIYQVAKPGFTAAKNAILKAVRETVEKQLSTPQELRDYCLKVAEKISI